MIGRTLGEDYISKIVDSVLVTGGISGTVHALAGVLANHGDNVIGIGRRKALLDDVSRERPSKTSLDPDLRNGEQEGRNAAMNLPGDSINA